MRRLLRRLLVGSAFVCPAAAAQVSPAALPDAVAPPLHVDARRVQARSSVYEVHVTSDSGTRHVGWRTVWVYEAVFSGRRAWEVNERRESHAPLPVRLAQDSVILSRESLAPLRWEAWTGDARFVAAFSGDSVYGGATAAAARSTFTLAVPGAVVTSEAALETLLQAAPLGDGWSASASMLVADLGGARVVPLHLGVLGREAVEVPAGRFDAWRVVASAGGSSRTIWVDARTGRVVRAAESPSHMPGMLVERVLTGGY